MSRIPRSIMFLALPAVAIACGAQTAELDPPAARARPTCGLSTTTATVLGRLEQPLAIRGYFSEPTHPLLAPLVPQIRRWLAAYQRAAPRAIRVAVVDPASSEATRREVARRGIEPFPFRVTERGAMTTINAYFHLLVSYRDRQEVLDFEDLVEARQDAGGEIRIALDNLEYDLTAAIKKLSTGARNSRVALWTPPARGGSQSFELLRRHLDREHAVVVADLAAGRVDPAIDGLVLAGPVGLTAAEARAVDAFTRRGGALVILAGRYRLDLSSHDLRVERVTTGLESLLSGWGVSIDDALVLDAVSGSFPVPTQPEIGGKLVTEVRMLLYPFFPRVDPNRIGGNLASRDVVIHFASPVRAGRRAEILLRSSDQAWLERTPKVAPDFSAYPNSGFARPARRSSDAPYPLAVTVGARVAIVGSSNFASDDLVELTRQSGGDLANLELVGTLLARALGDPELTPLHACRGGKPPA